MKVSASPILPETLTLPRQTLTGAGKIRRLITACAPFGPQGFLVCGRSLERAGTLQCIRESAPDSMPLGVYTHTRGEPTLEDVETLRDAMRTSAPDWVAAVGGGSVMDLAKAATGLLHAPLRVVDYHEGAPIPASKLPFVAAPTTAGTGSEATSVSVLTNTISGTKKSIRHPDFLPQLVILDPELLCACPPNVLAEAGMDAFTQAVESLFSRHATAWTIDLSLRAAGQIANALPIAFQAAKQGALRDAPQAREALLTGSFLAGVALAHARLGVVHGLAHPLGARFAQPHGRVCAVCLAPVLAFNREAAPGAYATLSATLEEDALKATLQLVHQLEIASPFRGKTLTHRDAMIRETLASGSTQANPRNVDESAVIALLNRLFAP